MEILIVLAAPDALNAAYSDRQVSLESCKVPVRVVHLAAVLVANWVNCGTPVQKAVDRSNCSPSIKRCFLAISPQIVGAHHVTSAMKSTLYQSALYGRPRRLPARSNAKYVFR